MICRRISFNNRIIFNSYSRLSERPTAESNWLNIDGKAIQIIHHIVDIRYVNIVMSGIWIVMNCFAIYDETISSVIFATLMELAQINFMREFYNLKNYVFLMSNNRQIVFQFSDHESLRDHFLTRHYLCDEGECKTNIFTASFRSDIDLRGRLIGELPKSMAYFHDIIF